MGTIVNFATTEARPVGPGVSRATLIDKDSTEMNVALLHLEAGRYHAQVPLGSDRYLFVIDGTAHVEAAGRRATMGPQTFAILQEGTAFTLGEGPATILDVVVPPAGMPRPSSGFADGLKVMAVKDLPVVDIPEEKKRRTYLASKSTVGSDRGHAMIVRYTGDTVTRKHHHPNAESMFVMLHGYVRFLVNGREETLGPGQAVHFPMNDHHGLRSADGRDLSFLELHIPGAFVTQYDD
jgi:mannose-6-phosphate isomerase-like protein (cupin superfamily)